MEKYICDYEILIKMSLTNTKTYATKIHGAKAARALLPNLRMHASLSGVA
jgi:hypothetical protein